MAETIESPVFGTLPVTETLRHCELLDNKSYRGILDDGTVVTVRSERPVQREQYVVKLDQYGVPCGIVRLKWKRRR
jgi:hypothetical protein